MAKFQYLIRKPGASDPAAFERQVMDAIIAPLREASPTALKLSITREPPPRVTFLPLKPGGFALVSVWTDADPTPADWQSGQAGDDLQLSGYRIDESVPVAYERDWPDGQPSPGVAMLTLLKRNPKLDYDAFMAEWHGRHTPKALRIHPLWNYIRNVVEQPVIAGSPAFEGLVEEHLRQRADLFNPVRFFGGPLKFLPHMVEVGLHAKHFLDLSVTENYLLTEIHLPVE